MRDRGRIGLWLYAVGALAGCLIALIDFVTDHVPGTLSARGIAASVNGVPIGMAQYDDILRGLAVDKRNPLTEEDRRHALDVLIDEELLFQSGINDGLARADPDLRKRVVNAALRRIIAEADTESISDAALAEFYQANRDYFAAAAAVKAQLWLISGSDRAAIDRTAAELAERRMPAADAAVKITQPLPDTLLPVARLSTYVGADMAQALAAARPDEIVGPKDGQGGVMIARVTEREAETAPPYDAIRPEVEAEYRRRRADLLMNRAIADLHRRATIKTDAP